MSYQMTASIIEHVCMHADVAQHGHIDREAAQNLPLRCEVTLLRGEKTVLQGFNYLINYGLFVGRLGIHFHVQYTIR